MTISKIYGAEFDLLYNSGEFSQNSGAINYKVDIGDYVQINFSVVCKTPKKYKDNPEVVFTDAELIK